jgi:hypothetical protein
MNHLTNVAAACAAAGLVLVASCGGDSTGPNSTRDLNGNWTISANYNNAQLQTSCALNGSLSIAQSGTTFTGQVSGSILTCAGPGGNASGNADGPVTGGQINGNTVSYNNGECTYTGTITGSPANRAVGSTACSVAIGGTTYPFTGTFVVSR